MGSSAQVIVFKKDGRPVKSKNSQMWKLAVRDFVKSSPRPGTIIKKEWLIEAFGLNPPDKWNQKEWEQFNFAWLHNFEKFKETLLEDHRIDIRKIKNVGYEVLNPKEQTRNALHEGMREIARSMNRMTMRVLHVDTKALNEREKKENLEALGQLSILRTAFSAHRRLSHRCYQLVDKRLKRAGYNPEEK